MSSPETGTFMPSMRVMPGCYRLSGRGLLRLSALCLGAALLVSCGALPPLENRTESFALSLPDARATSLGQAISPLLDAHPGKSGIFALADAHDAFAARALLARAAENVSPPERG